MNACTIAEPIRHATLVRAAPERVYAAIATAGGLDGWFTTGAEVDARPGGRIVFRWRNWGPDRLTLEDEGWVLKAVPGKEFSYRWHPDGPGYATTVHLTFHPSPEGTVVRVEESGYHDTPSGRRALLDCACGWGEALTLMKFYIENGVRC